MMEDATERASRAIQEAVVDLPAAETADALALNAAAFLVAYAKVSETSMSDAMIIFFQQITDDVNLLMKKHAKGVKP